MLSYTMLCESVMILLYQKKYVMCNYKWNCDDFLYQKKLFMYNYMYESVMVLCTKRIFSSVKIN